MIFENVRLALTSLRANKMRALLTMLGINNGIGSVIAIVTVGNSLTSSVSDSLVSLGGNNLQIGIEPRPNEDGSYPGSYSYSDTDLLTDEMMDALRQRFSPQVKAFILQQSGDAGTAQLGRNTAKLQMQGVNPDFFAADKLEMLAGRTLRQTDMDGYRKVAILSDLAAKKLFGSIENALGQTLSFTGASKTTDYAVVGIYKYKMQGLFIGTSPSVGSDATTELYIPLTTAGEGAQSRYFYSELVPMPGVDGDALASRLEQFFNESWYKSNPVFWVKAYNLQNEMASITSVLSTISVAIGIIAGISLLVGGIGVMNIMLVSITERTREIGIRKALGASGAAIRVQFIVESMIICAIGGVLGIGIGLGLGNIGAAALGAPAAVQLSTLVLAVGFSMAIGLFFGYYPAGKAAKMDPIEALRYE